jgi:hypothetical protein
MSCPKTCTRMDSLSRLLLRSGLAGRICAFICAKFKIVASPNTIVLAVAQLFIDGWTMKHYSARQYTWQLALE